MNKQPEQEQCGHESCDCRLYCKKQQPEPEPVATFAEAKQVIMQLSSEYQRARKAS